MSNGNDPRDNVVFETDATESEVKEEKVVNVKMKKSGGFGRTLRNLVITLVLAAIFFYAELPALHIKNRGMWMYLFGIILVFGLLQFLGSQGNVNPGIHVQVNGRGVEIKRGKNGRGAAMSMGMKIMCVLLVLLFLGPAVIDFVGSSKLLHSRAYSKILMVQEGSVEDIPSVEGTDSIALMDTASAEKLGNREIGSLSSVISQYDVSAYTQINYQGTPVKTSPLRYAGFFKWWNNRANGVPGYVLVNPVSMDADYVALDKGMKYVPSAFFQENLGRRIRFAYPTKMFENLHFEVDEEGNPWYVADVFTYTIGLFGGKQVIGAIIVDPVTGAMDYYGTGDIPQWTDVVFPGELICEQYNNYAQLHDGYWNSVIGQVGCRKVTEMESDSAFSSDFGYIAKDGDIWIYTGVTSVNSDSSNIGFILSNERTEETIFINCAGADEFSAMASARGEVQEKGYQASFPSLILVDGNPTYIMVLKDAGGLVKMYAAVNVEQYNTVATATTQDACIEKYQALVSGRITQAQATADSNEVAAEESAAPVDTTDFVEKTIKIAKLQTIDTNGNTYLYVVDEDGAIYHARYTDVIDMLLVEEGDTITIRTDGENFLLP